MPSFLLTSQIMTVQASIFEDSCGLLVRRQRKAGTTARHHIGLCNIADLLRSPGKLFSAGGESGGTVSEVVLTRVASRAVLEETRMQGAITCITLEKVTLHWHVSAYNCAL